MSLSADYTVAAGDTLQIAAGTTVLLDNDVRIYVEGELDIQGTASNPVVMEKSSSSTYHDGIQFNATSRNRGSVIQHLEMRHAQWGITIYDANPLLEDVTLVNPDFVGIDLFNGANPVIRRLYVDGGGQDVHGSTTSWRYGIGLSIGANSAPFVDGATFDGLILRGVNMWGNAGGMLTNIVANNITGATLSIPAGIWVEDSVALIDGVDIDRSDNGIVVRHMTDTSTTRPTFRNVEISNSMYRGIFVEQFNHTNWNAPLNAVFENVTIDGTGGPGAKTPGLCYAAIELNTTGVDMTDVTVDQAACNGFKAFMIGPATIIDGLDIMGAGKPGATTFNDRAGFFIRSANWAPSISNLSVVDSQGHGIMLWKANLAGHNWSTTNNDGVGLYIRESHPEVGTLATADNGLNGVWAYDVSNVLLMDVDSRDNGQLATLPKDGFGYRYELANDVTSNTQNVSCMRCSSTNDAWGGVSVEDSIDIWFHDLSVTDPGNSGQAVLVDNADLSQAGLVHFHGLDVAANRTGPVVQFIDVEGEVSDIALAGSHRGFAWDGAGRGLESRLYDSAFAGSDCLELNDLHHVVAGGLDFAACTGRINLREADVNITQATNVSHLTFDLTGMPSTLRWIDATAMPTLDIGVGSQFDRMWHLDVWAVNQHGHALPNAEVNLSFDAFEADLTATLPYAGFATFGPFIGQRTTATSTSALNDAYVGCDYDETHADTGPWALDSRRVISCEITLTNQAPLIVWATPEDGGLYPSGGTVVLNASDSWDLDNDAFSATWTSSIDGDLRAGCGTGSDLYEALNTGGCTLSDGVHDITLELCDTSSNCANETRQIELRNLPPVISIAVDPAVSPDGILRLWRTQALHVNASATTDPEGDTLQLEWKTSYEGTWRAVGGTEWNQTFLDAADSTTQFDFIVRISDGVNAWVEIPYAVQLENELPTPTFEVIRNANTSSEQLALDGSETTDPEGDTVRVRWVSDLIGELPDDGDGNDAVWVGRLPAGNHTITMLASDDHPAHADAWASGAMAVPVLNSPPVVAISGPASLSTDSSVILAFDSAGSGDWDLACDDFDANWSAIHLCSEINLPSPDYVAVRWDSSLVNGALGTDWTLNTRLPAGQQTLTFTVDDGVNPPQSASVEVDVASSAPVLVLTSPAPGIELYSDGPVLFDFRGSFDADGDAFTVEVTSDQMETPIIENGSIDFWYNDWLAAGDHLLTFTLEDATGQIREETRSITVLPTGPVARISGFSEGEYLPPGTSIPLNGSDSYDADDDIIQYLWQLHENDFPREIGNSPAFDWTPDGPGPVTLSLTVRDARGASDTAWLNLTLGSSNPVLSDLSLDVLALNAGELNTVTITVQLDDPDGTTHASGTVEGVLKVAGDSHPFVLLEDEGGQWSATVSARIAEANYASVEVWASDGEMSSNVIKKQVNVHGGEGGSSLGDWFAESGIGILAAVFGLLALAGGVFVLVRRRSLARDLEMIESWGGGLGAGATGLAEDDAPVDMFAAMAAEEAAREDQP